MQLDQDNKIEEFDQKVTSIQITNIALEKEAYDIEETTAQCKITSQEKRPLSAFRHLFCKD